METRPALPRALTGTASRLAHRVLPYTWVTMSHPPVGTVLTTVADLFELPLLAVILNPDFNPHAWQKRRTINEEDCTSTGWFLTTDMDSPVQPAEMFSDHESFIVLWLPAQVRDTNQRPTHPTESFHVPD